MKLRQREIGMRLANLCALIVFLMVCAGPGHTQSPAGSTQPSIPSRNPIRTIKVGDARFDYYENPAVAASSTFYLSGSHTNSLVFDFIGVTVAFANPGTSLRQPSRVNFHFVVATYRDGCKVRDRYASSDKSSLRVVINADEVSVFESDLPLAPVNVTQTRNGNLCMEMYFFEMPFDSLTRLASAGKATFAIGPRSLGFQRKHLDSLKVLVDGIGRY